MLDLIGHGEHSSCQGHEQPQCMVFEWMDTDLWQLSSKPLRSGSELPRIVARSILEALAVIDDEEGVHTDVNPNNVFLSGVYGPSPVVKLGDLGNCKFLVGDSNIVDSSEIDHSLVMAAGPMLKTRYQVRIKNQLCGSLHNIILKRANTTACVGCCHSRP